MKIKGSNKKLSIVLGISAIALTTVGFSAWVIAGTVAIPEQNVSVAFGDVTNNTIKGELDTSKTQDLKIAFDATQNDVGEITSTENSEDLSFTIYYKFTSTSTVNLGSIKFDITDNLESIISTKNYVNAAYNATDTLTITKDGTYVLTALAEDYKEGEDALTNIQTHVVTGYGTDTITVASTFRFSWGEVFKNQNPVELDDNKAGAELDTVKTNLQEFKDASDKIENKNIKVVITPELKK